MGVKRKSLVRGAQTNPSNRFLKASYEWRDDYLEYCRLEDEPIESERTKLIQVFPKTIVTKNSSPDVPFTWSINPYQGCEHGCIYCYARNSHEYWGYSMGKDFERTILYKPDAPKLLEKWFRKRGYKPEMIALSGNTDCYQPAERKLKITREILKVFTDYRHPTGMITKNALILRDLDLIQDLSKDNLVRVTMSITTLNEDLRRVMEPRTSSIRNRLKAVEVLSKAGVHVNVNLAPIIPALNSHELFDLVKAAADHGAKSVNYIMVRLNGQISDIFEDWVYEHYPDRADKVLNLIRAAHDGTLNDSEWGKRMKGTGENAEQIKAMFKVARDRFLPKTETPPLNTEAFRIPGRQLNLFS